MSIEKESFSEWISSMDGTITNYTENGKCSRCGACCNRILLCKSSEIYRIAKYIKHKHIQRAKKNRPDSSNYIDMTCPFYDEIMRKCVIYPVRPEVCRKFDCSLGANRIRSNICHMMKNTHSYDVDMSATFYDDTPLDKLPIWNDKV